VAQPTDTPPVLAQPSLQQSAAQAGGRADGRHGAVPASCRRCHVLPGAQNIIVMRRAGMAIWREKLFVLMAQCGSRHGFLPAPPGAGSNSVDRSRC